MDDHDWYPDELAYAGPEHLDPAYTATYDRKARTDWTGDLAVLRGLGLGADSTLVDLGAGTGAFATAVAPLCRRVVAVEPSPAMQAVLIERIGRAGLTNVEAVRAGFLTYAHEGAPADFVYTRNALHQLPDLWKVVALERTAALLRTGGVLRLRDLVLSCGPGEVEGVVEAWLGAAPERPEEGWTRAELATHLRTEYSTFSWLLEPMLERVGFAVREAEYSPNRAFAAYTCART
jgi:SAM-dependent methyltransferase